MQKSFDSSRQNSSVSLAILAIIAIVAFAYRFLPYEATAYILAPFGAMLVYAGARVKLWQSFAITFGVFAISDAIMLYQKDWQPNIIVYPCYAVYLMLGYGLMRRRSSIAIASVSGLCGAICFFLVTNAAAWAEGALPEYKPQSFSTLMLAYAKGLSFIRDYPSRLLGDIVLCPILFVVSDYICGLSRFAKTSTVEASR